VRSCRRMSTGDDEDILKRKQERIRRKLEEKEVPSSAFQRMFGFGTMAASMAFQSAGDRFMGNQGGSGAMSDAVAETFTKELCRMRGAALKVGQILSLQDSQNLPPSLAKALEKVRTEANVMPKWQLREVLEKELGENWETKFKEFDMEPFAAASIGQVHQAVALDGRKIAVKIQYPGVADSVDADMANLQRLLQLGQFIPKGLFLDRVINTAKEELAYECDYIREAENQSRFADLLKKFGHTPNSKLNIPEILPDISTSRILSSEWVDGEPVDRLVSDGVSQKLRDSVADRMLSWVIKEVFQFRLVQSDPNWSNFLYDEETDTLNLIDFGATNEYSKEFIDKYLRLVWACAEKDRVKILRTSKEIGFLGGKESPAMISAHIEAAYVMGEPFAADNQPFDFSTFKHSERMAKQGQVFLKERLVPPPKEVYTLHRKLFGAISTCVKLKAKVDCRERLEEALKNPLK